ncbi:MAG: GGDEF domain-containing protein [Gammaproteobacteria bacterium]|nr:GGDEF domain-containing protein [Gammaproteobacteria bacterium]
MRLVSRFIGNKTGEADEFDGTKRSYSSLADGALDTLGSVIRIMGDEAFPIDQEVDPSIFHMKCSQFAGHVENGAAVPAFDIPQTTDGSREWSQVRRFFVDRRRAEKTFVTERLHDYREVVEDLIVGLRQIGERDENTESHVRVSLKIVEDAVSNGDLPDIKAALSLAVQQVTETFVEQKKAYEAQLGELNSRMSNLRQDLVAAREEMKRDPLTDAYNRGAFDTAIEQSLNLHFVLNQPVTVVMVDMDNFKHVNDNFGHAAGDQALRAVGECLERTFIRKGDLVARYGGDEFAMILNDTSAQNATRLIERFLELAGNIRIADSADGAVVSCSAGYTEVHSSDSVETLVKRADRALYQAKAAGRNAARLLLHPDDEAAR